MTMTTSEEMTVRGGRKEILTIDFAKKIIRLIEQMPDAGIPVTWDNIERHIKLKFRVNLRRNVLSQKTWSERQLISEAYKLARETQRRLLLQGTPKYANSPRGVLRKRIDQLEAKVLSLQQELEIARTNQLTKLDLFRATRMDLRRLVEEEIEGKEN